MSARVRLAKKRGNWGRLYSRRADPFHRRFAQGPCLKHDGRLAEFLHTQDQADAPEGAIPGRVRGEKLHQTPESHCVDGIDGCKHVEYY